VDPRTALTAATEGPTATRFRCSNRRTDPAASLFSQADLGEHVFDAPPFKTGCAGEQTEVVVGVTAGCPPRSLQHHTKRGWDDPDVIQWGIR
jgi:hypothetical protein